MGKLRRVPARGPLGHGAQPRVLPDDMGELHDSAPYDNLNVASTDYSPYCLTLPADTRLPGGGGNQVCGLYNINPNKFGDTSNILVSSVSNYRRAEGNLRRLRSHTERALRPRRIRPGRAEHWPHLHGRVLRGGFPAAVVVLPGGPAVLPAANQVLGQLSAAVVEFAVERRVPESPRHPHRRELRGDQRRGQPDSRPSSFRRGDHGHHQQRHSAVDRVRRPRQPDRHPDHPQLPLRAAGSRRCSMPTTSFNNAGILAINTRYGAQYRRPTAILDARILKFGAQINF